MTLQEIEERLFESKMKGHCCSQSIIALCLEDMDKENEDMIRAMAAFCGGMGRGRICGTLAAVIAALHVKDPVKAAEIWQDEFMDWFEDRFGAYDCEDLIGSDPRKKIELCPVIVLESYIELRKYCVEDFA